jgi:hypothetical protein
MRTQANSRYLPLVILGIAVVLFSMVGIAKIMGLLSGARGNSGGVFAFNHLHAAAADAIVLRAPTDQQPAKRNERAKGRCAECGVIVSVRLIERDDDAFSGAAPESVTTGNRIEAPAALTADYEITIRISDGSIRKINLASPAPWRPGERMILIAGTRSPTE